MSKTRDASWSRWNPFRSKTYRTKAAPVRSPAEEPDNPNVFRRGKVAVIVYSDVVNAQEAQRHPVIGRCLNIIASAVQSVRWFAEVDPFASADERANKARVISDIDGVLRSPNDRMTGGNFRYWMALNWALYARVPFVVGQSDVSGTNKVNALYPLNARAVTAKLDNRGLLSGYEYGLGEDITPYPKKASATEGKPYLYEIARPRLDGTFTGAGTGVESANPMLCAIALPAQVINLLLQRAIDAASGHPNTKYIIVSEKTLTKKQKEDLADHIENMAPGQDESGNVLLLYNQGNVQVHKVDNSLADIHSKVPLDDMTRMIAGAFGIPIALVGLGAADAAKFAGNYSESRRVFWADTIIPMYLTPFSEGMTQAFCPPGVRVVFDLDSIDALRDHNIANAEKLEKVTYLSNNEKRELVGFAPVDTPINQQVPGPGAQAAPAPAANNGAN